jgi:phage-related tail fiber protein
MKSYGIEIAEGTDLKNATIEVGASYPVGPSEGELFYHTVNGLSVFDGAAWKFTVLDDDSRFGEYNQVVNTLKSLTIGVVRSNNGLQATATIDLGTEVSGNLGIAHLNSGVNASTSTYLRGDGTWAAIVADWSSITNRPTTVADSGLIDALQASDCGMPLGVATLGPDGKLAAAQTTPVTTITGNAATATALQTARTISLSSEVSGSALFDGKSNINIVAALVASGVTAGTYPKVTVSSKGIVTAGAALLATDIPVLDWSKITTGKPTTLAGYGITDAASSAHTHAGYQPIDADLTSIGALAGTAGILKKTAANTWVLDTSTYLVSNQAITVSGDATGSGTTSIALTLASTGVTAGTYPKVVVDAKGRVTSGSTLLATDIPVLDWSKITTGKPTTLGGYGITDAATSSHIHTEYQPIDGDLTSIAGLAATTGILKKTAADTWTLDQASYLTMDSPIFIGGDFIGTGTFGNATVNLSTTGVVAGTYLKVVVDDKGRVTSGSALVAADIPALDWSKITTGKPTTLGGYGITDAVQKIAGQGQVLQMKFANLSAMSGTSLIPADTSSPLSTEGTLAATVTITPATTSSRLGIALSAFVDSNSSNRNVTVAVFRGTQCIGASMVNIGTAGRPEAISINLVDSPSIASAITYTVRLGTSSSATWYLNQSSAGANYGGMSTSTITVTEYS